MKRMEAKAFNMFMPPVLHAVYKDRAREQAAVSGGQPNMNKVFVTELYNSICDALTDEERAECESFLGAL
jgi:hypothetical protein